MTLQEVKAISRAVLAAKDIIETLACPGYPYTEFSDPDCQKLFYDLNEALLMLCKKEEALTGERSNHA